MIDEQIQSWLSYSWLSPTDRAFVNFIAQQEPNANDLLLWACALVSQQLNLGAVYVDLAKLSQNLEAVLGITCVDEVQRTDASLATLKATTLSDWLDSLSNITVVSLGEGSSPLVLSGQRLYLRRYWQCQQVVDQEKDCRIQGNCDRSSKFSFNDNLPKNKGFLSRVLSSPRWKCWTATAFRRPLPA